MHTGKKPDIYRNKKLALFRGAPYNCRQLQIKTEFNSMKFSQLQTIADTIAAGNSHDVPALIDSTLATIPRFHANRTKKERDFIGPLKKESAWHINLRKLSAMIETGAPAFTVIAEGNGKLPFLAFSSLPGRGFCPGAGDCLQFCYSFRAWRYPAAFARQAQNAVLMQSEKGRAAILAELDTETARIKGGRKYKGGPVDFRLYVDGDYSDASHVAFWFNALHARPDLAAYGYSKSSVVCTETARGHASQACL
jgi:hypothetical protein